MRFVGRVKIYVCVIFNRTFPSLRASKPVDRTILCSLKHLSTDSEALK